MRVALVLCLAACSGSAADSASGGDNVGFGGASDIGQFRSLLEAGGIPGPGTLDANGFFSEHFSPAPAVAAACEGPLCLTAGFAFGRDFTRDEPQALLHFALSTNPALPPVVRRPLRLAVVIDCSGSMAEQGKLEYVKVGLRALVEHLTPGDEVALIAFSDGAEVRRDFTADPAALLGAIDELRPEGGTNIGAGLALGFEAIGAVDTEHQQRVLLLSDGLPTVGVTSAEALIQTADVEVRRGVGLTTVGVGLSFDVELMRSLAERGAGSFYFLEDPAAATEVFTEELDVFVAPIALDVRLDAMPAQPFSFGELTGATSWRPTASGAALDLPAVFVAGRTSQTGELGPRGGGGSLFVELAASGLEHEIDVALSYQVPGEDTRRNERLVLAVDAGDIQYTGAPRFTFPELAERYAMYNVFRGLTEATEYAAYDYGCAAAVLRSLRASIVSWRVEHTSDDDLDADLALIDRFLENLAAAGAPERAIDACPGGQFADDDLAYQPMACASGGTTGGATAFALVALVLLGVRRRGAIPAACSIPRRLRPAAPR